nr:hypothetical protein [uncultured Pseudomonas sp.]
MIDLSGWPVGLRLTVLLIPCAALLIGLAINYYLAMPRQFDLMCTAFSRSKALHEELATFGSLSWTSRLMVIAGMTACLTWPFFFIRCGALDPLDYRDFPGGMKRRMLAAMGLIVIGLLSCVSFVNFITW